MESETNGDVALRWEEVDERGETPALVFKSFKLRQLARIRLYFSCQIARLSFVESLVKASRLPSFPQVQPWQLFLSEAHGNTLCFRINELLGIWIGVAQ